MQAKLIKGFLLPSYFRNHIANCVCLLNSIKQELRLYIIREEFNLQRQFHTHNIYQMFEKINTYFTKGAAVPLLRLKPRSFLAV
jgi:hypothetical protein